MTQHRGNSNQQTGLYLDELLVWRLADIPITPRQASIKAGVSTHAMADALSGDCKKLDTLSKIAKALELKWEYLFKPDLPRSQFWRAVLNKGSDSVR